MAPAGTSTTLHSRPAAVVEPALAAESPTSPSAQPHTHRSGARSSTVALVLQIPPCGILTLEITAAGATAKSKSTAGLRDIQAIRPSAPQPSALQPLLSISTATGISSSSLE